MLDISNRKVYVAKLLTINEVSLVFEKLRIHLGLGFAEKIDAWIKFRRDIFQHQMAGGKLTEKQSEIFEFINFKLDDWASD